MFCNNSQVDWKKKIYIYRRQKIRYTCMYIVRLVFCQDDLKENDSHPKRKRLVKFSLEGNKTPKWANTGLKIDEQNIT